MEHKGQGTIEYLVIIAIVIVIALVVVGLLLQVMNAGSGVPETQAKATWKSAEPFAIIDWGQDDNLLTVILQNNSGATLEYNDMNLTSSNQSTATAESVAAGATKTVTFDVTSCTAGNKFSHVKSGISIDYNTANIDNKTQVALADILGTC